MTSYPDLTHLDISTLTAGAGGDPWKVDASVQAGQPQAISDLGAAFHKAAGHTQDTDTEFVEARKRFEASWNRRPNGHPINDAAEVQQVVTSLKLQSEQLGNIAVDLASIAAKLAETQQSSHREIAQLNFKLRLADAKYGEALEADDADEAREWKEAAIAETRETYDDVVELRTDYALALSTAMSSLKSFGYGAGAVDSVDGYDGATVGPPEATRPGSWQDMLTPADTAAEQPTLLGPDGLQPPTPLDQLQERLTSDGPGPGETGPVDPLLAPVVAGNRAALERQATQVAEAWRKLGEAQRKANAAAAEAYVRGPGNGPDRDVLTQLAQDVFDARRELKEEDALLGRMNDAHTAQGGRPVPRAPLPENIDVQSFAPPPGWKEHSRELSESSLGLIPDVAKHLDTIQHWDERSNSERTEAVAELAGLLPLPGLKAAGPLARVADGVIGFADEIPGATRVADDIPTPDVPHHTPHDAPDAPDLPPSHPDDPDVDLTPPNHDAGPVRDDPSSSIETGQKQTSPEPVDLATGEYLLPATDVDLPGVLPLRLTRQHRSQYRHGIWFGPSWPAPGIPAPRWTRTPSPPSTPTASCSPSTTPSPASLRHPGTADAGSCTSTTPDTDSRTRSPRSTGTSPSPYRTHRRCCACRRSPIAIRTESRSTTPIPVSHCGWSTAAAWRSTSSARTDESRATGSTPQRFASSAMTQEI
ncbi:hypothetical protein MCNF_54330 [Mycolicibacterium confluentis]|uniref:Uncharacterized protein n=1 Tax=Mycolicibacterium confluentis TaxID=28047 RepID=A0A7I7Y570_9MYCO|nr:hypothetical protein MCNF_54330 [Mycolicibacterium confluentis]